MRRTFSIPFRGRGTDEDPRRDPGLDGDGPVDLRGRSVHGAHAAAPARAGWPAGPLPRARRRLRQLLRRTVRRPAARHVPAAARHRVARPVLATAAAARGARNVRWAVRGVAAVDAGPPPRGPGDGGAPMTGCAW